MIDLTRDVIDRNIHVGQDDFRQRRKRVGFRPAV
jgi:hypothetical protein